MSTIATRKIGNDDVPAIGFGLMGISNFYGAVESDEERFKVLDAALEIGSTFWDTSDIYMDSEVLIGKWFMRTGSRDKIFLATNFGATFDQGKPGEDGSAKYVRQAIERNLKRLQTDRIDLYYILRVDREIPIEVTIRAMAELVKEGKVRYLGISECSAATLRRAHAVHPISAVQLEYSPLCLEIEDEKIALLKTCRELGVKVVAYCPLGRGLLTGAYRSPDDFDAYDFRRFVPKFSKENFPNILKLADEFKEIGKKHNATAGQVCLAWIVAQGDDIIPIPGAEIIKHLKENFDAVKINLTAEDLTEIRGFIDKANADIQGDRYPPDYAGALYADTVEEV